MKNIFKKAILPLLVFGIAIAGVFATNSSVVLEQPSQPLYTGVFYYQGTNPLDCIQIEDQNCTLVDTNVFCTWMQGGVSHNVYAKLIDDESYSCTIPLYKRTIP